MAVFACNQNFAITGSSVDAKDVTFYIAKYMQKDSHALAATASAFFLAQDHVQKYGSVATDADTSVRKAQHLLTNTINRIEGAIELSQDQAANLALGFQADQCNWKFWYCYIGAASKYVQQQLQLLEIETDEETCSVESDDEEDGMSDFEAEDAGDVEADDAGIRQSKDLDQFLEKDERPGPKGDGSAEIYEGVSGSVAVPMHVHYAHRGAQLQCMNFYEYCSCVQIARFSVVEIAANSEAKSTQAIHAAAGRDPSLPRINQAGRKCNKNIVFDDTHPLCTTHKQQLRSKLRVPVPVPPPPRMHSNTLFDEETHKTNDAAAAYYMVLFFPWTLSRLPAITYAAWAEYCRKLQKEESVVSLHRLAVMTNMSNGLGTSPENDKACTSYRYRNVHKWNAPASDPDGTARPPGPGQNDNEQDADSFAKFAADTDDAIAQLLQMSEGTLSAEQSAKKIKKMNMENSRLDALMMQVQEAFPDVAHHDAATSRLNSSQLPPGNVALFPFLLSNEFDAKLGIDWLEATPSTLDEMPAEVRSNTVDPATICWPSNETLSSSQSELLEIVKPLLLLGAHESNFNQKSCLMVHGGAGTGKSYFVHHLAKCMPAAGVKMRCGTFAASASKLLPFSNTLHSLLCIPFEYSKSTYKPLGLKELEKQRKAWNNVRVIVIDEISMVPVALLGWVSMRLQQITNVPLPFGGLVAILMGDVLQIPSIPQPTLAEAVLLCAAHELSFLIGSVPEHAMDIMRNLRMFKFIEQRRSQNAEWTKFLQDVRSTFSLMPMMPYLRQSSISNMLPDEAKEWAFPKIATPGNAFRMRLNNHQIQRHSHFHQLPLFKWSNTIKGVVPAMPEIVHQDLLKNDPRFFQCFCYGAPVTLMSNFKSNATEKGVSNGTKCTLHAISCQNPVDQQPFINPDRPAAADVWIRCPKWVVLATVDKFEQAMFPGCEEIPAEALTSDGRLLIYLKSTRLKKVVKVAVLETESLLRK
jgi:hypothetical protein